MVDIDKVRSIMPLQRAMAMYSLSDKERFECQYPECEGARPNSTFYADFSVADVYGIKAIKDTYKNAFNCWKDNVQMYTEFVAALNHKIWAWYESGIEDYSKLYNELWEKADKYGSNHFKGDDASHYFKVLD